MKEIKKDTKGYMVTLLPNGEASCVETHHRYREVYVMAFDEKTPTTMRILVNGKNECEAEKNARTVAEDIYNRRNRFEFLGMSYRNISMFKDTPIQMCPEAMKAVYEYSYELIMMPNETDKLPDGFSRTNMEVSMRISRTENYLAYKKSLIDSSEMTSRL